jgi:AcrR family transcriptional regulator
LTELVQDGGVHLRRSSESWFTECWFIVPAASVSVKAGRASGRGTDVAEQARSAARSAAEQARGAADHVGSAAKPDRDERAGSPRQRARTETEAALKAAARRVFARQGYLNTKIVDITAEAGRAAGSFYNHFASKEALLEALAADLFAEGRRRATEGPGHDLGDPEHLREHVAATWYVYRDHLPEISALLQASLVHPEVAARVRQLRAGSVCIIEQHLVAMRDAGYELPGAPDIVASAMVSLLEQFCTAWQVNGGDPPGRRLTDGEAIDTLTRFIRFGLAGPGSAGR